MRSMRQRREHGRLVSAPRADLQQSLERRAIQQRFGHARHDIGLRDRLAKADRQGRILVSPTGDRLIDEDVARQVANAIEHGQVADALIAQPLHQAIAGTKRSHAYAAEAWIGHGGLLFSDRIAQRDIGQPLAELGQRGVPG